MVCRRMKKKDVNGEDKLSSEHEHSNMFMWIDTATYFEIHFVGVFVKVRKFLLES